MGQSQYPNIDQISWRKAMLMFLQQSTSPEPLSYIPGGANNRIVMDRDRRLTGYLRGQTDNPSAPAGFELNNPWRVGREIPPLMNAPLTVCSTAREAHYLDCSDNSATVHIPQGQWKGIKQSNYQFLPHDRGFSCGLHPRNRFPALIF